MYDPSNLILNYKQRVVTGNRHACKQTHIISEIWYGNGRVRLRSIPGYPDPNSDPKWTEPEGAEEAMPEERRKVRKADREQRRTTLNFE